MVFQCNFNTFEKTLANLILGAESADDVEGGEAGEAVITECLTCSLIQMGMFVVMIKMFNSEI